MRSRGKGVFKTIGIVLFVLILIGLGVIYYFRFNIFQYSAERVIREKLPPYLAVKNMVFDLEKGHISLQGVEVKGPAGYQSKHIARIKELSCDIKLKGSTILDGIEVTEITADGALFTIERRRDGHINVNEMKDVLALTASQAETETLDAFKRRVREKALAQKAQIVDISDFLKLTDTIDITNGKVLFLDNAVSPEQTFVFNKIEGDLKLSLSKDFKEVLHVSTKGSGIVNNDPTQLLGLVISLDPGAKEITMSNRIETQNVDITLFRSYYEKYSPIFIEQGYFSGTLVFDFDHGNIGSTNVLTLKGLRFREKESSQGAGGWQGSIIPSIIKYLQSSPDEIVFDFKIKGTVKSPRFYPGDRVKAAIKNVAVSRISEALFPGDSTSGQENSRKGGESDMDQVVDLMRGFFK